MERLAGRTFEALGALPAESSERASVGGTEVEFTTVREAQPDGSLLVLVRSDRRSLLGLVRAGTSEGFFAWADGRRREALAEDILDHLG